MKEKGKFSFSSIYALYVHFSIYDYPSPPIMHKWRMKNKIPEFAILMTPRRLVVKKFCTYL